MSARIPPALREPKVIAGLGAGAVALLVLAVWLLNPDGSGFDDTLTGPVAEARLSDEEADGPLVTRIHPDCGMSEETVELLVADAERGGMDYEPSAGTHLECTWEDRGVAWSMGGASRDLRVDVRAYDGGDYSSDPIGEAARGFSERLLSATENTESSEIDEVTHFTGLGDDAALVNAIDTTGAFRPGEELAEEDVMYRSARTSVLVRVGNTVLDVAYSGADYEREDDASLLDSPDEELLDEETTWGGAILAAEEIVEGLGRETDADLVAIPTEDGLFEEAPDPCFDLPPDLLSDLGVGADPTEEEGYMFEGVNMEDLDAENPLCEWGLAGPALTVEVGMIADERVGAVASVSREYTRQRQDARMEPEPEPQEDEPPNHLFAPLSEPGDAAYTSYVGDDYGWEVETAFRDRNLLVRIRYRDSSTSGPPPSVDEAVGGAHRVAVEVADRLPEDP